MVGSPRVDFLLGAYPAISLKTARLKKPKILERSLQSYMSEIAPFNDFLEESLVVEPEGFITGGRAIPEWSDW